MSDTYILLVYFEEGLQIEFAVALIASYGLIVINLLRFVLMSRMLKTPIQLVSRGKELVAA